MSLSWLAWVLVLGIVIFVHELGHFLAAKWAGVYAPRFSLGWGSPLWSFRRGETEYALSWLPIGGYVRMASREDETAAALEGGGETGEVEKSKHWDEDSMIPHGPKPIPADRWFESKPLYKKLVILLAGVVMNIILAIVVSVGLAKHIGDRYLTPVADSVVAGMPAAKAGMLKGDSIVAVNGKAITRWDEAVEVVTASPDKAVELEVMRGAERVKLSVTPAPTRTMLATGDSTTIGRMGVNNAGHVIRLPITMGKAVAVGLAATKEGAGVVAGILGNLLRGKVSITQLGGPVEIARASVAAAREGLVPLWGLIALLSINLAVINLLPIPLLDGGQVLMQVAEAVWRKPLPMVVKEWYARIGLVAIGALFLTVTFNDIKRIVMGFLGN